MSNTEVITKHTVVHNGHTVMPNKKIPVEDGAILDHLLAAGAVEKVYAADVEDVAGKHVKDQEDAQKRMTAKERSLSTAPTALGAAPTALKAATPPPVPPAPGKPVVDVRTQAENAARAEGKSVADVKAAGDKAVADDGLGA